jgi:hypothetical protein
VEDVKHYRKKLSITKAEEGFKNQEPSMKRITQELLKKLSD